MKWKGALATELSGSLGGITASRNAGGPYFRARVTPVNPGSVFQAAVRGFVASLTSGWNSLLTPGQRDGWNTYALNVQIPDAFGDPRNVSGIAMYVRSNVPRLQAGLPRVDDGPAVFNLGPFTNPGFETFVAAANTFDVTFTDTDAWANEDNAAMIILASRPQNPSVNFFKGPYRFAGLVAGASVLAPTSPETISAPFNIEVGQRIFVQARVSRADGRLALPFRGFGLGA